jgi:ligand-binding sensor protein
MNCENSLFTQIEKDIFDVIWRFDMAKYKASESVDLSSLKITDVIDLDFLQRFQDNFAKGMGLASVTVDDQGNPVTKPSCYTEFCMNFTHSTKIGDDRCAESHRKGGEEAARTGKPAVYHCHAGLIDFAAPIILEGRQLGTILGGQILAAAPEAEQYQQTAAEIGVDPDKYVEAVNKIEIRSKESIQAAAEVLFMVANNLSKIGYSQYKLKSMSGILHEGLTQIAASMEQMAASALEVSQNQNLLNQEINNVHVLSEQINEVLAFIKQIADATKMLGLNAAIEAARSGEAGRGFSVVAQEIRKLSDESKQTVTKIRELTDNIQKSVGKTLDSSSSTLSTTEQQASAVQSVTASVEEIMALSEQLTKLSNEL